ncbi:MAG TPA: NAD-dependent epimerase/dehydratase family protein [Minicystis sp.]|nr:NAD-dependent epimerase/dehydratase family protein [Minicystis sp.]
MSGTLDGKLRVSGKAFVTGASGFIGRRVRDALLDAGVDVVAIRRAGSPEPRRGRSAVVDYADAAAVRELVAHERPDYVVHVAGATKGVTLDDFRRANVMPTEHLARALAEAHPGVKRFVHVSSLTSYGPSSKARHHREGDPRRPIEFYGMSKLEAEQAVEALGERIPWTILRPGGVYGPGDADYFELFKSVERGMNVFFGNKDRLFSAVFVDDLVRAIDLAATAEATRGKGYFVSDGAPVSWGEFQRHIVEASGRRVVTIDLPEFLVGVAATFGELATKIDKKPRLFNRQKAKMGAEEAWTCHADALAADAAFAATVLVPEGVRRTLAWYRAERWV